MRRAVKAITSYFKRLGTDYSNVLKEALIESRNKPLKTAVYAGILSGLVYANRTTPDERHLLERLAELRQQMVLVPASIHSSKADAKLEELTELYNKNRLDIYNCWFFSLVVRRHHNRKCNLYAAQDPNLRQWPWIELWNNLIDVGAFSQFWYLERSFIDYDIREEEFQGESLATHGT